jgi:hypothetical protein
VLQTHPCQCCARHAAAAAAAAAVVALQDNLIRGRFLAELTREVFGDLEQSKYQHAEMRISVYGRKQVGGCMSCRGALVADPLQRTVCISLTAGSHLGRQCHSCCERTCLRVTPPPISLSGRMQVGRCTGCHCALRQSAEYNVQYFQQHWAAPDRASISGLQLLRDGVMVCKDRLHHQPLCCACAVSVTC